MGIVKKMLEEDMMRNPEEYNAYVDYDFWMQCRKEELLEKEGMNNKMSEMDRELSQTKKEKK